jgi:type II secretory pathway component PulF
MKYDEFAFFNQQLAAMLRDGIPLEGALKRLCEDMRRGRLRDELQALEADLARGMPMAEALKSRQLPELYKRMILVGVKSGDLPGALTMLADYFQRQNNLWTRLKGLMVYPLIVVFVAFLISTLIAFLWTDVVGPSIFAGFWDGMKLPAATVGSLAILAHIWIFPVFFGSIFSFIIVIIFLPALRDKFRWRIPAFKEASISRVAASLNLLLKNGTTLPEAITLVEHLEDNGGALKDMQNWKKNIASGIAKFSEVAASSRMFPPMFIWTVANSGENLAEGFNRAAEIYQARAIYRTEVALYSALPVAALFLGMIVLTEAYLVITMFLPMISMT